MVFPLQQLDFLSDSPLPANAKEAAKRAIKPLQEQFKDLQYAALDSIPEFTVAFLVLLITWAISRLIHFLWPKILRLFGVSRARVLVTTKLFSLFIWIVGLLTAMVVAFPSITPAKALTTVGLGSIALGFAFKDIIENWLAGTLVLLREPFQLSDFVRCGEDEGVVEEITVRETHIRRSDGQRVVLPNSYLMNQPVTIVTDRDLRRICITLTIAPSAAINQAKRVIVDGLRPLPSVASHHPILVLAHEFTLSGITLDIFWWTGSKQMEMRKSRDEVVTAIKRAFREHHIALARPIVQAVPPTISAAQVATSVLPPEAKK